MKKKEIAALSLVAAAVISGSSGCNSYVITGEVGLSPSAVSASDVNVDAPVVNGSDVTDESIAVNIPDVQEVDQKVVDETTESRIEVKNALVEFWQESVVTGEYDEYPKYSKRGEKQIAEIITSCFEELDKEENNAIGKHAVEEMYNVVMQEILKVPTFEKQCEESKTNGKFDISKAMIAIVIDDGRIGLYYDNFTEDDIAVNSITFSFEYCKKIRTENCLKSGYSKWRHVNVLSFDSDFVDEQEQNVLIETLSGDMYPCSWIHIDDIPTKFLTNKEVTYDKGYALTLDE